MNEEFKILQYKVANLTGQYNDPLTEVSNHWKTLQSYIASCGGSINDLFVEYYPNLVAWDNPLLYEKQKISEECYSKNIDKVDPTSIIRCVKLSLNFLNNHIESLHKRNGYCKYFIPIYQILSEDFIMKHLDKLDFAMVAIYQDYSLDFIKNNLDKFNSLINVIKYNNNIQKDKVKRIIDILEQYSDMM